MHERGLPPRRAHTTRQLLPHPALSSNRRSSRSSGCFAYLTQKVNSSTYYKSRDSRSKDSKEGDGADVLKEVPLGRGNRGTRGQLVSQGSQNNKITFSQLFLLQGWTLLQRSGHPCLPCWLESLPPSLASLSHRSLILTQGKS